MRFVPSVVDGLKVASRTSVMFSTVALLSISLLSFKVSAEPTAADYYVHSLPGAPSGPLLKMHAGHVEVNEEHHANLFFWHFQNRHIANRQRTVIWLNGGPGCSSEDGALMEIGPYRLKNKDTLEYNDGSWDEFANIMFVDNPVGTGFSYVNTDSYLHELPEMADQFITFLDKFFALFPEYASDDIYLAGESYAGQHIPYIAKAILEHNKALPESTWNLKGMLIGNGWISPVEQYEAYLTFAYEEGLIKRGSSVASQVETQQAICLKALKEDGGSEHVDVPACEAILMDILRLTVKKGSDGKDQCVNMYDVRLRDTFPSCGMNWPPDLTSVTPYLRRPEVVKALHVSPEKKTGWTECNGAVGGAFRAKTSKPAIDILPALVEQVPTVLFSGAKDLICNHIGTEELIHNMEWGGGKGFELSPGTWAPKRDWTFEGKPAGIYQEARNLTYILFYNSSHMVPFDYARRTRDMLDRFMSVDIASIGGTPADSRIDGEKGLETSVGGHPNSTAAEAAEQEKLDEAKWHAYRKSGEVVLVIVVIAATAWFYYIWRERRARGAGGGYTGLLSGPMSLNGNSNRRAAGARAGVALEGFRGSKRAANDLEAADFDESELDDLHVGTPHQEDELEREQYSVGSASDDGNEKAKHPQGDKSREDNGEIS